MTDRLLLYLLLAFCCIFTKPLYAEEPIGLKTLDEEIKNIPQYQAQKEGRIKFLEERLKATGNTEEKIGLRWKLYNEYRNYQSDTARMHVRALLDLAQEINSPQEIARALVGFMDYFNSSGYYKEAGDVNQMIIFEDIPKDIVPFYLDLGARLYGNLFSSTDSTHAVIKEIYHNKKKEYLQSLLINSLAMSYYHGAAQIDLEQMETPSPSEMIRSSEGFMSTYELKDDEKAIQYSKMAEAAMNSGNTDEAKHYLVLAAICDIKSNNRESAAITNLATLLHGEGDRQHSYEYLRLATEEAEAFNSHQKLEKIDNLKVRLDKENSARRYLSPVFYIVTALIGLGLLGVSIFLLMKLMGNYATLRKAKRSIKENREVLGKKNTQLLYTQREMEELEAKLRETQDIKNSYIRQSLYVNTGFVNMVEKKLKSITKLVREEKYNELKNLHVAFGVKEERNRIFRDFDLAFLKLFPNFIEELNKLMPSNDPVVLENDGAMPSEVRIFALIRLGITDPAEIAKFLNLSVKTVYVYKTRMKSKSLVDNNEFETFVMSIPKP